MHRIDGVLSPVFTWEDWASDEIATNDDDGLPVTLTGLLAQVELRDRLNRKLLSGSSADGAITFAGNLLSWFFPQAAMASVPPGNHFVALRVTDPGDGTVSALAQFSIEIKGGAFQ